MVDVQAGTQRRDRVRSTRVPQHRETQPAEDFSATFTALGDLGGLSIAWKAYQLSLEGADPPVIDGLTAGERFFLGWAQAWRTKLRDEEALRLLSIDPHSPAEFRCNQIVRNIDVFYSTFGVTEGDALWLDPEDRVTIW